MARPLSVGPGWSIGQGWLLAPAAATPGVQWDANPTTYIAQYDSSNGNLEFYCLNCTNQTPDPNYYGGALTYFQIWIRNDTGSGATVQAPFTVFDATLGQSFLITPTAAAFSFSGGIQYTMAGCTSSAPTLTNITQITQ